jgi:hypothetical protein
MVTESKRREEQSPRGEMGRVSEGEEQSPRGERSRVPEERGAEKLEVVLQKRVEIRRLIVELRRVEIRQLVEASSGGLVVEGKDDRWAVEVKVKSTPGCRGVKSLLWTEDKIVSCGRNTHLTTHVFHPAQARRLRIFFPVPSAPL